MPFQKREKGVLTAYKTAIFEIHNPSHRKIARLRDALCRNHLAYTKLLDKLDAEKIKAEYQEIKREEARAIKEGRKNKRSDGAIQRSALIEIERRMRQRAAPLAKPLPLAIGAKAGVVDDLASQMKSHIALSEGDSQERAGIPTAARLIPQEEAFGEKLKHFIETTTLEEETKAKNALLKEEKAGILRPILFLKNRRSDGFLILYSEEKKRYFIYLNLSPKESRFADKEVCVDGLVDVRTGEVMKFKSKTGLLFPVSFGRDYQEIEYLLKERAQPQSAKLLERNGRFEVHVSFKFEADKKETTRHLGVDRGIYNLISLCVIDDNGAILYEHNHDGKELRSVQKKMERRAKEAQKRGKRYTSARRRADADEEVHKAVNWIVKTAREYDARVIMENLSNLTKRKGKRGRSNFNRLLNRQQYGKVAKVLEYKLSIAGLPRAVSVYAGYTSQTCPECGHLAKENRPKPPKGDGFLTEEFRCVSCGYSRHADLNGARVIAMRKLWREFQPPPYKKKSFLECENDVKYGFSTFLREKARRRGKKGG